MIICYLYIFIALILNTSVHADEIDTLISDISRGTIEKRIEAIEKLGSYKEKDIAIDKIMPLLIEALGDKNNQVQIRAIIAIIDFKDKGEPYLVDIIKSPGLLNEIDKRINAINAIGSIGDSATLKYLTPLLEDSDARIRGSAVISLGKIGDIEAASHIVKMLGSEKDAVNRRIAISVLASLNIYDNAISLLKKIAAGDEDILVRKEAVIALTRIRGREDILISLLELMVSNHKDIINLIVERFTKYNIKEVVNVFKKVIDGDAPSIKISVLKVLASLSGEDTINILIKAFYDENRDVRLAALDTALKRKDKKMTGDLAALLNDPDWQIRIGAASALGATNDKEAVKPLVDKIWDHDKNVQLAVISSLAKLKDKDAIGALIDISNRESDEEVRNSAKDALKLIKEGG